MGAETERTWEGGKQENGEEWVERKGRRGAVESRAGKTEGAGKWKTRVKEGKTERGGCESGGSGGGGERRAGGRR